MLPPGRPLPAQDVLLNLAIDSEVPHARLVSEHSPVGFPSSSSPPPSRRPSSPSPDPTIAPQLDLAPSSRALPAVQRRLRLGPRSSSRSPTFDVQPVLAPLRSASPSSSLSLDDIAPLVPSVVYQPRLASLRTLPSRRDALQPSTLSSGRHSLNPPSQTFRDSLHHSEPNFASSSICDGSAEHSASSASAHATCLDDDGYEDDDDSTDGRGAPGPPAFGFCQPSHSNSSPHSPSSDSFSESPSYSFTLHAHRDAYRPPVQVDLAFENDWNREPDPSDLASMSLAPDPQAQLLSGSLSVSRLRRSVTAPFWNSDSVDPTTDELVSASTRVDHSSLLGPPSHQSLLLPSSGSGPRKSPAGSSFPTDRHSLKADYDNDNARSLLNMPAVLDLVLESPSAHFSAEQPSAPDAGNQRWIGNFYVWIYDRPAPASPSLNFVPPSALASSPAAPYNLPNPIRGGFSKHFFNNVSKAPEPKFSKLMAPTKKVGRAKKGLIALTSKPREAVDISSPVLPVHGTECEGFAQLERVDVCLDQGGAESVQFSQANPRPRFGELDLSAHRKAKKKHSASVDIRGGGKKKLGAVSGSSDSLGVASAVVHQLALGPGQAMNSDGFGAGHWKLVQGIITEDGYFTLYTSDNVMLHRVYLPSYRRTDIRLVHQSIFGRLYCGVISRRVTQSPGLGPHVSPALSTRGTLPSSSVQLLNPASKASFSSALLRSPIRSSSSVPVAANSITKQTTTVVSSDTSVPSDSVGDSMALATPLNMGNELSIYLCMPNSVNLETWLVICKCFCRPDDFRHLYPRHNVKKTPSDSLPPQRSRLSSLSGNLDVDLCDTQVAGAAHVGAPPSLATSKISPLTCPSPERVRIWRGLELQLLEGRRLGEPRRSENPYELGNDVSHSLKPTGGWGSKPGDEPRRNSIGGDASIKELNPATSAGSGLSVNRTRIGGLQSDDTSPLLGLSHLDDNQNVPFSSLATPALGSGSSSSGSHNNVSPASKPNQNTSRPVPINNASSKAQVYGKSALGGQGVADAGEDFYFVELVWDKEIIGRSTIKRNSSPFWREEFRFSDLGSFKVPLVMNVYQIKKNLKRQICLIGSTKLDLKEFTKDRLLEVWLPVYSIYGANEEPIVPEESSFTSLNVASDCRKGPCLVGELNISILVHEQVILNEVEYTRMMELLNNDEEVDLPYELSQLVPHDLERLAQLLLKLYEYNEKLMLRLAQMAAIEVDGDVTTASILFRGNTLLTKLLEGYMRMVGASFLESSIGPIVRRVCTRKVELEIDPARLKGSISPGQREKVVAENAKVLNHLANEVWQSMYVNRSKCPSQLRRVFARIQELVSISYSYLDLRVTCVSAFVFLRFFVPAILNPRLFNLIQFQPDLKSQRTLTLLAKTLQGLGNLNLFGSKEPWMSVMNVFIQNHLESFRDYIAFLSQEPELSRLEWTSKEYDRYELPYALRSSLPPASRDGIPLLPHLLDPVRDAALLAGLISNAIQRNEEDVAKSSLAAKIVGSTGCNKYAPCTTEFMKICQDLHSKAARRHVKIVQSESKNLRCRRPGTAIPAESIEGQSELPCTFSLNDGGPLDLGSSASGSPGVKCPTTDSSQSLWPGLSSGDGSREGSARSKRSHTIASELVHGSPRNGKPNMSSGGDGAHNIDSTLSTGSSPHLQSSDPSSPIRTLVGNPVGDAVIRLPEGDRGGVAAYRQHHQPHPTLNVKSSMLIKSPTGVSAPIDYNPLELATGGDVRASETGVGRPESREGRIERLTQNTGDRFRCLNVTPLSQQKVLIPRRSELVLNTPAARDGAPLDDFASGGGAGVAERTVPVMIINNGGSDN